MSVVFLLNHHRLTHIPEGRSEQGRVLVISGALAKEMYECAAPHSDDRFASDITAISEAYVYVGSGTSTRSVEALLRSFQSVGKKVHMVGCDCNGEAKRALAEKLGVEWIVSDCGGRDICLDIIARLA